MPKKKFWERNSDLKDTIFIVTSIFGLIFVAYGIYTISTVFVLPKSNLDFCPHTEISGSCGINPRFSCGEINLITSSCTNSSKLFGASANIFNKGLAISNNVELVVTFEDAEFPMKTDSYTETDFGIQINNNEVQTRSLVCYPNPKNCSISYVIDVIKPNDFVNIRFYLRNPHEADIIKNPIRVIFELKENDHPISIKVSTLQFEK